MELYKNEEHKKPNERRFRICSSSMKTGAGDIDNCAKTLQIEVFLRPLWSTPWSEKSAERSEFPPLTQRTMHGRLRVRCVWCVVQRLRVESKL